MKTVEQEHKTRARSKVHQKSITSSPIARSPKQPSKLLACMGKQLVTWTDWSSDANMAGVALSTMGGSRRRPACQGREGSGVRASERPVCDGEF